MHEQLKRPSTPKSGPRVNAADRIARFVSRLEYDELPEAVIRAAKYHALDTIGVGIAAAVLPGEGRTARASVALFDEMGGRAESSIVGREGLVPAASAAFANGSLQHSLDFDDIHTDSRVHTSTMIVPAAFAVAERENVSGRALVTAMVVGHEIATRIGMGGPRHFQKHGFHGTPVSGIFGVVASAAKLAGLDQVSTAQALGVAGDAAGGTNAWIAEGTTNKHLHAGWAAHGGILSADLAARGAEGPPGVFEGRFGLYEAFTGEPDVDMDHVLDTLGTTWETPRMAFKAYPACYWIHGSLDSALEIRDEILEDVDEIEWVEAIVPTPAISIVLEPSETRIRPLTPYAGKFSMQFSVAAMLLRGTIDLSTYTTESMADERVLDLAAKVGYRVSDEFDEGQQVYPGGLVVHMRDGREFVASTPEPRGTVLNPMSDDEVIGKFRSCAMYGLSPHDTFALEEAVLHIERPAAVSYIGQTLRNVRAH